MANPIITVQDVSKAAENRQLLDRVSFVITAGSLVSLIGPNGAGKSTMVKIILGLDTDYTGSVSVRDGERIRYIPQLNQTDGRQLPISVYEYLSIGVTSLYRGSADTVDYDEVLRHVGVAPEKCGQSFTSLSGGEQQRVAIARALLADPTVLVLDEPLAAVDYASRAGLYELIRHLQKDHSITVLLVSHDIESVMPISDQILCLNTTLSADCHPSKLTAAYGTVQKTVQHHC